MYDALFYVRKCRKKIKEIEPGGGLGEVQGSPGRVLEDLGRLCSRSRPNEFLKNFGRVLGRSLGACGVKFEYLFNVFSNTALLTFFFNL